MGQKSRDKSFLAVARSRCHPPDDIFQQCRLRQTRCPQTQYLLFPELTGLSPADSLRLSTVSCPPGQVVRAAEAPELFYVFQTNHSPYSKRALRAGLLRLAIENVDEVEL